MEQKLKHLVAELFEADLHTVNGDFLLSTRRMQGSLARAKLDAAIRNRLGVTCRAVYSVKTYGELQKAVLGREDLSHAEFDAPASLMSTVTNTEASLDFVKNGMGVVCGIDIEMVENFPEVDDYWNDPFYTNSFSSVEIAYCLLQENPRMHFAARWCAKEALKKCESSYLSEEMKNLEVVSNNGAPPILRHYQHGIPTPIPFAVSLSHTPLMAAAMTIKQVNL